MNYLKHIRDIKRVEQDEHAYMSAKLSSCEIIDYICQQMYDAELDRTQYVIWQAIRDLLVSVKYRY